MFSAFNSKHHILTFVYFLVITTFVTKCFALDNTGVLKQNQNRNKVNDTIISDLDLATWDPPDFMKKNFPYYLMGHDYEDRPVWVVEFGKFDLRGFFERGGDDKIKLYEKYSDQLFFNLATSPKIRQKHPQHHLSNKDAELLNNEYAIICDLENYDLRQLSSPLAIFQTLKFATGLTKIEEHLAYFLVLNTNYVGQSIISIVRPVLGGVFAKFEVYGTNKEKWIPQVLKKVPKDNLPEWYGGFKNYTPIVVFG